VGKISTGSNPPVGQLAQEQTHALSFRSQVYRREICLLPAAKQQIPRATIPRFGMTSIEGHNSNCGTTGVPQLYTSVESVLP